MILVQLHGGMGNQMFQAAAGLALARRLGSALAFDLSRFRANGLRAYALEKFELGLPVNVEARGLAARLQRLAGRLAGGSHRPAGWSGPMFQEAHFHYDSAFERLAEPVLLAGYFQSPRYFAGAEAAIADAFHPRKLASSQAQARAMALAGETSAAIHVRRGDYARDPAARAIHGVLGFDYYDRAVAVLQAEVPGLRLFVFSDDAAAAEEAAARWPGAEALRGASAGDDLFLMSQARHHIIANSSFSWWSAWLDRRPGGIRIAPRAWFAEGAGRDTRDLLPADWLRL